MINSLFVKDAEIKLHCTNYYVYCDNVSESVDWSVYGTEGSILCVNFPELHWLLML